MRAASILIQPLASTRDLASLEKRRDRINAIACDGATSSMPRPPSEEAARTSHLREIGADISTCRENICFPGYGFAESREVLSEKAGRRQLFLPSNARPINFTDTYQPAPVSDAPYFIVSCPAIEPHRFNSQERNMPGCLQTRPMEMIRHYSWGRLLPRWRDEHQSHFS